MELITDTLKPIELKNNMLIGVKPVLNNTSITFLGKNNVLFFEENVSFKDSKIVFSGDNALIYIGNGKNIRIKADVCNNSVLYIGKDNYFNPNGDVIKLKCSEQKHIFIGNRCLIAENVEFATSDSHLIYSIDSRKRINHSKSIFIGDSVWIGQGTLLLKGCQIHSGSVIGAESVISNKIIDSNCIVAGNPCRQIKRNIFWGGYTHINSLIVIC